MPTRKKIIRPDLQIPIEEWGTIKGATDKLTWFARIDVAIAAGIVPRSFLHVAVRIATEWLNKETGLTWRSAENLASDIGMAKSSVEDLLEAAVAAGLLVVVKRGQRGRGKHSTIYRPAMPDVLIPGGPGFRADLKPDGPGFTAPDKRNRKSRFGPPANPGFGPFIIPAHRDDLPEEVIPDEVVPAGRGSAARTTRVDGENVRNSTDKDAAPSKRAPGGALIDPVEDQHRPPSASPPSRQPPPSAPPIGRAAALADDPAFDAVRSRARKLLGTQADMLVDRLIDAYDGESELILDTLACAEEEPDPREYVEQDIEQAQALARNGGGRSAD